MNIVVYSYNFFPQADAESFCATRFASALARAGHNVTVVTMDWPMQVSEKNYHALVADELKIIRLPFSPHKNSPLKALLWYGHKSQMAVDVPQSVKTVKRILKSLDTPILVTRTHPVMSTMVGLKTYKYAYKWIAHFSDPLPWMGYANTIGHRLLKHMEMNIVRKAFIKADGISVTCKHVNRYFKEVYGSAFDTHKVFVTTHIGDYRLEKTCQPSNIRINRVLLHPGSIFADRGGLVIPRIMHELFEEKYDCKFIQVGYVDKPLKDILTNSDNIQIYNTISLEASLEIHKLAKAIFVPDFTSELPYSPFLLSKFVYHIMTDKPLVIYSKRDSEMHDYAETYPEAGIFWAEAGNITSLKDAIKAAMDCNISTIDRTRIRTCFAEDTIVHTFVNAVNKLTN